ncbi:hypothetical protein E3V93_16520 [Microbacterium sp. 3H14]|uniref:hypothetical protein n=1 Tax=unclassified Microbacterium TaxID=2609290 RepID=UPI00106A4777|nr:hypothetical protein [Microbacterium sp. 3H14]TFB18104.1 hypothetical protein E3V93_16520 [Microbacterium sp. 3H14]
MTVTIITIDVMRLRASKQFEEMTDTEVAWEIKVADRLIAPSNASETAPKARPVHATLFADGPDAWGDIDLSALVLGADQITAQETRDALQASPAIETLYDFARTHLQSLLGTVRADYRLPMSAPAIEVEVFELPLPEADPVS